MSHVELRIEQGIEYVMESGEKVVFDNVAYGELLSSSHPNLSWQLDGTCCGIFGDLQEGFHIVGPAALNFEECKSLIENIESIESDLRENVADLRNLLEQYKAASEALSKVMA